MPRLLNATVGVCAAVLLVLAVLQANSREPGEPTLLGKALAAESEGNTAQAEVLLRKALETDRGSLARSTLANFYLRHEDDRGWPLLADALTIAIHGGQDVSGIFESGWQFRPDGPFLLRQLVGTDPAALTSYTNFLLKTGRVASLPEAVATVQDQSLLLVAADALYSAGKFPEARKVWDRAVPPRLPGEILTNVDLRSPKPLGFDWRFNSVPEAPVDFADGMRIDFTGRQPDPLELLIQTIPLSAGQYSLTWQSQANREPGVFWRATGAASFREQIHPFAEWRSENAKFEARTAGVLRLALVAERLPGTSRFEGTFRLRHPSLRVR